MSTQNRRNKRARVDSDQDEFIAPSSTQSTQRIKVQASASAAEWSNEERQRKIKDVVRFALACEFKKKTFKRDDVAKIIGNTSKRNLAKSVLDGATAELNRVFGFTIAELPTPKEKMNQSQTQMRNANTQSSQAPESSTQAAARTGLSNTYMLLYNMKESYRTKELFSQTDRDYKEIGILYVILGLLFLNGQTMPSPDLYEHLTRLKLTNKDERNSYLDSFIRNNYLKRTKKPETSADEIEYDFTWGGRAKLEFPVQNCVEFLLSFYNISDSGKEAYRRKIFQQGGYQVAEV